MTYAGKAVHDPEEDGSRTTRDRGWATPTSSNVRVGGHLVLDAPQGSEGWYRRAQAGGGQARQLVGEDRHLLLGGEDDLDAQRDGSLEHDVEPCERVLTERGDPHQTTNVPGEAGQAQWVADGRDDLVAELVELSRDLPGCQPGALREHDPHDTKYMR